MYVSNTCILPTTHTCMHMQVDKLGIIHVPLATSSIIINHCNSNNINIIYIIIILIINYYVYNI